ncbi:extracellular solute-binding protein [Motilimonas cestriensis]|uniref:Extracellular solute-binding protein n=1 Tax=Motilimonas cestriensis TaxID=2742685 RepID=A0ABS8WBR5_9GAMM|nr:extracellular solute-binding protein [Motilimonas cestriensis]MCE2594830.1 extracellular solute-binding protein [Motilimonas cestriensis]
MKRWKYFFIFMTVFLMSNSVLAKDNTIRVLTWEGYVKAQEVHEINLILRQKGYDYKIEVIQPWAEGPEQMFEILRNGEADISFLTLNYINMQNRRIGKILQPINVDSPRLPNYKRLIPVLKDIPSGMYEGKHLYVPWGGGAYGIWANMSVLTEKELPVSVKDLWRPEWKGRLSLTEGQIQPNLSLVMMALGKTPFYLNEMKREELQAATAPNSEIQIKTNQLYANVGYFWNEGPDFSRKEIVLVSSYGVGTSAENRQGGNWKLLALKEGNTVWLDTINIHKNVSGRKLEAAEVFINYWLGPKVQNRVVNELGMVSASLDVSNPLLSADPDFFKEGFFWPPWGKKADNVMRRISNVAMGKQNK